MVIGDKGLGGGDGRTELGYPSADFPGRPAFRFVVPTDWRAVPTPEADAVVAGPEDIEGVRPNVVIATHRVAPTEQPEELLRSIAREQRERVDGRSVGDEVPSADRLALSSRFTRRVTVDREVEQSLNLRYLHGSRVAHVLAATGTYASSSGAGRAVVTSIVHSVTVEEEQPEEG